MVREVLGPPLSAGVFFRGWGVLEGDVCGVCGFLLLYIYIYIFLGGGCGGGLEGCLGGVCPFPFRPLLSLGRRAPRDDGLRGSDLPEGGAAVLLGRPRLAPWRPWEPLVCLQPWIVWCTYGRRRTNDRKVQRAGRIFGLKQEVQSVAGLHFGLAHLWTAGGGCGNCPVRSPVL